MGRKAIYTEEEAKQRKLEQIAEWQKKNTTINIRVTQEDKKVVEAYAKYKGLPIGTLIRQCLTRCMTADEWHLTKKRPGEEEEENQGTNNTQGNQGNRVDISSL